MSDRVAWDSQSVPSLPRQCPSVRMHHNKYRVLPDCHDDVYGERRLTDPDILLYKLSCKSSVLLPECLLATTTIYAVRSLLNPTRIPISA